MITKAKQGLVLGWVFLLVAFVSTTQADVNVKIIGSEYDSSKVFWTEKSRSFPAAKIRTQLENILNGAGVGTAKVVYEDHYQYYNGYECFNLASWFHWPYPAGATEQETESNRWANLRGEGGTQWDYVILIGDPYTMEQMPGLYTHGVAKVADEVAKGTNGAETVLLMPWPAAASDSTVAHYKEVVYRTGRSGGFKVVPAGLAWQAAGSPADGYTSTDKGAYLAAASIYSRLWNKSAKESSYTFDDALADTVHATVTANVGAQQYTGKWDSQSPFKGFNLNNNDFNVIKAWGGTSTEDLIMRGSRSAISRAGIRAGNDPTVTFSNGRRTFTATGDKDYRNRGDIISFGHYFPSEEGDKDLTLGNIFSQDIGLAKTMKGEWHQYRILPHRLLAGGMLHHNPAISIYQGGHMWGPRETAIGTYIVTILSGYCPMDSQPATITDDWIAQKVGYEMAWNVSTLQARAPGFKVMPSSTSKIVVTPDEPETMTVQFILPPKHPVTVNVSITNSAAATVSPQTLTFTPENYNIPQQVSVNANTTSPATSGFKVEFDTSSDDEVCDNLKSIWSYSHNIPPTAAASVDKPLIVMPEYSSVFANANSFDADGDNLSYTWTKVSGPGDVTFLPSWAHSTIVAFTNAGTYVLGVTVSDASHTASSEVTVTVEGTYGGVNPNAGLWFGSVTGERNLTAPNPKTTTLTDLAQETENSLTKIMTEIYTGQIYDEDGIISFRESFYGGAAFYINGVKVFEGLTRTATETSGVITVTPGWNDFEIRVWSPSGQNGYVLKSPAIGYDPDGGGNWRTFADSGDGSFLRKEEPTNSTHTIKGTPYSWLDSHGMTNDYDIADLADPDGDGALTWQEYLAGTIPTNPASVFRFMSTTTLGSDPELVWYGTLDSGVTNHFVIYRCTNLVQDVWISVSTNVRSASGTNTWVDSGHAGTQPAFYRVGIAP